MKCLYDCGIEHGYSEACASPESPYYDSELACKLADEKVRDDLEDMGVASDDALIPVVQSIKRATLTQVERNARWRAKNREKYNAWMRDYRARKKGESK